MLGSSSKTRIFSESSKLVMLSNNSISFTESKEYAIVIEVLAAI
jgi:hypothetical protein